MKLRETMTKDVTCCSYNARAADAARLMWDRDVGCTPVVDEAGVLIGMVTDRDVCMGAYTQGKRLEEIPVSQVMAREVFTLSQDDTIERAQELMREKQVRRIPVVDDGRRVVGIVSLNDLALAAVSRKPQITPQELSRTIGAICQHRPLQEAAA